jgi:F-type H+-transporting ATPase subunit delta
MKLTSEIYARLLVNVSIDVAGSELNARIASVLELMKLRGDAHLIPQLIQSIDDAYQEETGEEDVSIRTASKSDDLITRISKLIDRHVENIDVSSDESLIGGAVVRIGDTVIDASVKGALTQLKKSLA